MGIKLDYDMHTYDIMMIKFVDVSQSDRSNWVMWQVKYSGPRPGWDGCLAPEK